MCLLTLLPAFLSPLCSQQVTSHPNEPFAKQIVNASVSSSRVPDRWLCSSEEFVGLREKYESFGALIGILTGLPEPT